MIKTFAYRLPNRWELKQLTTGKHWAFRCLYIGFKYKNTKLMGTLSFDSFPSVRRELRWSGHQQCWGSRWWRLLLLWRASGWRKTDYVDEEQCRAPCKGDPTFFCGGTTALHIYAASERVRGKHRLTSYPDQHVQLGGFVLEIAVTRRQLCPVQLRRLKTSV